MKQDSEKLLSKAGVKDDTTVVLCGDTDNWFAAWGAWVFDTYGVKNVKLLDGGRKKWEAESRAGHIPGAVNVPWGQAVQEDGTFKPREELRKLYAGVGIDGSKPVITYCRIGERSSHTWFALSKILGYDVKNYDGSWTEYGNAVGIPITNPAGTVWAAK